MSNAIKTVSDCKVRVIVGRDEAGNTLIKTVDGFSTDHPALAVIKMFSISEPDKVVWGILHKLTKCPIGEFHTLWGARACAKRLMFFGWQFWDRDYFTKPKNERLRERILAALHKGQQCELDHIEGRI